MNPNSVGNQAILAREAPQAAQRLGLKPAAVLAGLNEREQLGSTGFGQGVADQRAPRLDPELLDERCARLAVRLQRLGKLHQQPYALLGARRAIDPAQRLRGAVERAAGVQPLDRD